MKYSLVNRDDRISIELTDQFRELAAQLGMTEDRESPDVVLSIGGDGTLLHAFHLFIDKLDEISFVGIHTGHLGFFADWKPDEIELLAKLMSGPKKGYERRIVKYPLAEMQIHTKSGTEVHYALNEFTVKGAEATLVARLDINDETFEMFRGDGICISTPAGSTAYNKSLGGAIIHPSLETIQIAEIASINNRVFRTLGSSIILPRHHHCDIYPKTHQKIQLFIDHLQVVHDDIQSIRCRVADKRVSFARFRPFPFWTRVKEAFINSDKPQP